MIFKEMKKLRKTNIIKYTVILNIVFLFVYMFKEFPKKNFFDYVITIILDLSNVLLFYNIVTYVILGEIISNENSKGLISYLRIQTRKNDFVILSKLVVAVCYSVLFLFFDILIVLAIALMTKNIAPYEIIDSANIKILTDPSVQSSVLRFLLLNTNIVFGIIISALVSGVIAVSTNNKISTIITSVVLVSLLTFPIYTKNNKYSLIWYKLPMLNLDMKIEMYQKYILTNGIIYIIVIMLIYRLIIWVWRWKNEI